MRQLKYITITDDLSLIIFKFESSATAVSSWLWNKCICATLFLTICYKALLPRNSLVHDIKPQYAS